MTVSVLMITYNHEKFIAEAIEGVLMQEVDFEVELIIADDCSPDNTENIVRGYIENHPKGNWIKYTKHQKNKGMNTNFIFAYKEAKGEYIAFCEGDDYWTDRLKLKKQVDFLKTSQDFSGCCTQVMFSNNLLLYPSILGQKTFHLKDSISHWFAHSSTLMFRNRLINLNLMDVSCPAGDVSLYILLTEKLPIQLLPILTSVYRIHEGGITNVVNSNTNKILNYRRNYLNHFNKVFNYRYNDLFLNQLVYDHKAYYKESKLNYLEKIKIRCLIWWYSQPKTIKDKVIFNTNIVSPKLYKNYLFIKQFFKSRKNGL